MIAVIKIRLIGKYLHHIFGFSTQINLFNFSPQDSDKSTSGSSEEVGTEESDFKSTNDIKQMAVVTTKKVRNTRAARKDDIPVPLPVNDSAFASIETLDFNQHCAGLNSACHVPGEFYLTLRNFSWSVNFHGCFL